MDSNKINVDNVKYDSGGTCERSNVTYQNTTALTSKVSTAGIVLLRWDHTDYSLYYALTQNVVQSIYDSLLSLETSINTLSVISEYGAEFKYADNFVMIVL